MRVPPLLVRGASVPVVALASLGFLPKQRAAPKPFVAAVVDRGAGWVGIQPVARFTGSGWVNDWPAPEDRGAPVPDLLHVPAGWLGKPVPRQWVLWSASGARLRARVTSVRRADGCSGPIALVLAQTPATAPERLRGFQVAVDSNQPVETFRPVTSGEPEWRALQAAITDTFRAHEGSIQNGAALPLGDLSTARLLTLPVAIESLMRPASSSGPLIYYFEAVKRLPVNRARGVSIAGWMTRSARGAWTPLDVAGRTLGDDSGPVPERTPLGLFRLAGRTYWLMRITGYESTDTVLYDVSASGAREILVAGGSGC